MTVTADAQNALQHFQGASAPLFLPMYAVAHDRWWEICNTVHSARHSCFTLYYQVWLSIFCSYEMST